MLDLTRLESIHKQVVSALNDTQPARQVLLQIEKDLLAMIQDERELEAMIQDYADGVRELV